MKRLFYIFSIIIIASCTSNTIYEQPKDLIPKDTMVALISDMMIANAAKKNKNKNLEVRVNYVPLVFDKFKIDSARFSKSNLYYTSKMQVYEELMLAVKERLKVEEEKYTSELNYKDSIDGERRKKLKEEKIKKIKEEGKKKNSLIVDELPLKSKKKKTLKESLE